MAAYCMPSHRGSHPPARRSNWKQQVRSATSIPTATCRRMCRRTKGYLDVYDHYSLCRPRAVFGHGIHLTDDEMQVMHRTGSAIAHCPTSNLFLGSGYFNIARAMKNERSVRVGLGTDLGAGTSFSILATLNEAYKAEVVADRRRESRTATVTGDNRTR